MAVSSIKGCWSKLSARIRDYIDVVDSFYRPPICDTHDIMDHPLGDSTNCIHQHTRHQKHHHHHHHHHYHHHSGTTGKDLPVAAPTTTTTTRVNPSNNHTQRNSTKNHPNHYNNHNDRSVFKVPSSHRSQRNSSSNARASNPMGFTKRKTPQGQVYFLDSHGNRSYYDPSVPSVLLNASLDLDALVGQLQSHWEVSQTSRGKTYYINHLKQTTQFTDPRLVAYKDRLMNYLKRGTTNHNNEISVDPVQDPIMVAELHDKISILRQELLKQQVLTHPCRIDINRKRIFEESFRIISQMQPRDLKKRLLVKFKGEEGLDYGGVAREWFYLLSKEILNPVHGLFQYTSDDNYNLQINPDSGIVYREHLSYLNFCGRVIGMAAFHGHFIEGRFTLPFYKMLLKRPITLADIEFVDPELYRSLCWILDNDITNVIDTTFLVQHNAFGQLQEHELKEDGKNIVVNEENKFEYVSLYVNYRCRRGIEQQFAALQRGFHELISPHLVENFNEYELELLIGGLTKIDIADWRLNTKLKNCTVDTPLVMWFWDIVKSYDEVMRARLLQFVTGCPRVPIQGFKALQGVNSELRLFTIHLIRNACTDNLPKSHTCFNRIDLPPYETYGKLHDKLTQAIEETIGFAIQ